MDITSATLIVTITLAFALFVLRIILIIRRCYLLQQQLKINSEQPRVHSPNDQHIVQINATVNNSQLNDDLATKEFDLPPTYDEVMKSYLHMKQKKTSNIKSSCIYNEDKINLSIIQVHNGSTVNFEDGNISANARDVLNNQLSDRHNT
ncbi:uncharacterized protein ACN427_001677 [Glossina fuscipes fuscipes]